MTKRPILPVLLCSLVGSLAIVPTVRGEGPADESVDDRIRRLENTQREHEALLQEQRDEIARLRGALVGATDAVEDSDDIPDGDGGSGGGDLFQFPGIWTPRGDTAVRQFDLEEFLSLGFGLQYRVMYNASDLPGPGGTTITDTRSYDFMRQRLRLNLGVAPKGVPAGGFVQTEFRGGFGGTSPNVSDPRAGTPTVNPFNRLEARGVRYGYLFAEPFADQRVVAGILPLSDHFGDTLFSADWDFNTGGAALLGACGPASYRVGYLRLIDGVGAVNDDVIAEDGSLIVLDWVHDLSDRVGCFDALALGAHAYYLRIGEGLPMGDTDEAWIGPTLEVSIGKLELRGFAILNVGRLGVGTLDGNGNVVAGFDSSDSHTGYAFKLEAAHPVGPVELSLQTLYSSGDAGGRTDGRFTTVQGLVGTEGYWAYNHIFTSNPPSDVNDLAVDLGNGGAGLWTVQGRARIPILEWLRAELTAGWFQATRSRGGSRDMGVEVAGALTVTVAEGFQLDVGTAGAFLGDFYGQGAEDLYEIFVRGQFQF